ncbi:MAG: electron transfer flavoprotein subunit alpha/FixB family protein [Deltaproteobacteria bacterium]|nr:electron transfer flavoprotein subunit alpha/FixB family protein [Deltaproteobacteria bacterium]
MGKGIWVFAEQEAGNVRKVTFEMLSEARKIADAKGDQLCAVCLGKDIGGLADKFAPFGADKAYMVDGEALGQYTTDAYAKALSDLISSEQPSIVLFGATVIGKDLAPKVAARVGAGLASDCVGIKLDGDSFVANRPMYAGKAYADVSYQNTEIMMASIRPNVLIASAPDASRSAEVVNITPEISADDVRVKVLDVIKSGGDKADLTEAEIIVSGGRGMKAAENYKMLEDLADVIGATVGASRAAVDAGWRPVSDQVGQTGKVVSPNLYIACGISGAIQHYAGMGTSKVIVAINKDEEAPILTKCDFAVVDDLHKVVPALTEELKKMTAE